MGGELSDKLDQSLVATIQENLTAVKTYAKGSQFIYNGLLYKTTAAINSGGTITIGGNCELSPSVTEQIPTKTSELKNDTYSTLSINMVTITLNAGAIEKVSDDNVILNKGRYLITTSPSMGDDIYSANFALRVANFNRIVAGSRANLIGCFTVEADNSSVGIYALNWSSSSISFSRGDPSYKYWQITKIGEYN